MPLRMTQSIYLDYAATSAVRPGVVIDAVTGFLREVGGTRGRAGHSRALEAGRIALRCRGLLARLIGVAGDPGRIVFQQNATHALNTAIFGVLEPGDAVVRTSFDHNAVRRPVQALIRRGVREHIIPVDRAGQVDADAFAALARTRPRLLVLPHGSNVTGTVLPVARLTSIARDHGILVLLDAAQTVGHIPVDVDALAVDMVAFSGHKGVPGPQGVGCLWVREGVELRPLVYGGTGGDSAPPVMPLAYPDHLEAGTQNAPGIAGLEAAARWALDEGVEPLHRRTMALKAQLLSGLEGLDRIEVIPAAARSGLPVVLLNHRDLPADAFAHRLERQHGVQGRAGLHCAPEAHRALGTFETGALRLSPGWATTNEEIDVTIDAIRTMNDEVRGR